MITTITVPPTRARAMRSGLRFSLHAKALPTKQNRFFSLTKVPNLRPLQVMPAFQLKVLRLHSLPLIRPALALPHAPVAVLSFHQQITVRLCLHRTRTAVDVTTTASVRLLSTIARPIFKTFLLQVAG